MFRVQQICHQSIFARIANLVESFAKNIGGLKGGVPAYHYLTRDSGITAARVCSYAKNKVSQCHIKSDVKPRIAVRSRYQDRALREEGGEGDIRCATVKKRRFQFLFLRSTVSSEKLVLSCSIYPDWRISTFDFSR